jgi:hypothetical protein
MPERQFLITFCIETNQVCPWSHCSESQCDTSDPTLVNKNYFPEIASDEMENVCQTG